MVFETGRRTSGKVVSLCGREKSEGALHTKNKNVVGILRFPERKEIGIRVDDGGWHFGYMGGHGEKDIRKRVQEKVVSAAHQEYNSKHVLSNVTDQIKDGKDIFGRDAKFVRCEIDESFPQYIREHQKELDFLIMHEEKGFKKTLRRTKVTLKSACYKTLVMIKRTGRKILGR